MREYRSGEFAGAPVRIPYSWIWVSIFLFCLLVAEAGRLFGFVGPQVLDGMATGANAWWSLPSAAHVAAAVALVALLALVARRLLGVVSLPASAPGRVLSAILLILGIYLCLLQYDEMGNVVKQTTDFGTIHGAATALRTGGDPYAATNNAYFYPPFLALLMAPLTWLPAAGASLLFFTGKLLLVIWALAACSRLTGRWPRAGIRNPLFLFGLVFVGARFWMSDLEYGNTNILIMALVIAAIDLDHRDLGLPAGLALAAAASIKLVPGLLALHFLIRGRWRALVGFGAGLLLLNAAPFIAGTDAWPQAWRTYFEVGVAGKLGARLAQPDNQSLWGLLSRLFPDVALGTLRAGWATCSLLMLGAAAWISFRTRERNDLPAIAAAALYPLLGLLISPGSWVVHYTAVLLPMALLWRLALDRLWRGPLPWILLGAAHFAFTVSGWARATVNASIEQSWFVLACFALALGLGSWALRRHPPETE